MKNIVKLSDAGVKLFDAGIKLFDAGIKLSFPRRRESIFHNANMQHFKCIPALAGTTHVGKRDV